MEYIPGSAWITTRSARIRRLPHTGHHRPGNLYASTRASDKTPERWFTSAYSALEYDPMKIERWSLLVVMVPIICCSFAQPKTKSGSGRASGQPRKTVRGRRLADPNRGRSFETLHFRFSPLSLSFFSSLFLFLPPSPSFSRNTSPGRSPGGCEAEPASEWGWVQRGLAQEGGVVGIGSR